MIYKAVKVEDNIKYVTFDMTKMGKEDIVNSIEDSNIFPTTKYYISNGYETYLATVFDNGKRKDYLNIDMAISALYRLSMKHQIEKSL